MKTYTITGRARSSLAFRLGETLAMDYALAGRSLHLEMHTRRKGPAGECMGDLQVTAQAEADTVEEAAALMTRGREMAILVAVATNAAIEPIEAELVYEITPGVEDREFFQRFMPEDQISYADRIVPLEATASFLSAVAGHKERNRLIRAISQYSEALQRWENGNELLVLSHLFMGVEAIKKAAWRSELTARGITKDELAKEWGFDVGGRMKVDEFLDRTARLRLVFQGDALHHRIAKDVSDSFEHGFANGGDLFKQAASALVPTAAYLRMAIIGLAGVPPEHRDILISEKFSNPRGPAGLEQYFRGRLLGPADEKLPADGQEHPYCVCEIEVAARRKENGSHEYTHTPKITPMIGSGIRLVPLNHEVWARGTFSPKPANGEFGIPDGNAALDEKAGG